MILAGELLKRANDLVRNKIHPTSIIAGYRLAVREAVKYIEDKLATPIDVLGTETILNCAKTSMSSKIVGADSDFFARMVVDAATSIKTYNDYGDVRYPIKSINILKAHGKSVKESQVIKGYALNMGRAAQGMVMDLDQNRFETFDELYLYCYRVAGTVGLMMMPIMGTAEGYTYEEALEPALALGVALQLTNILRDVGEDRARQRIYLPQEELRKFGVTEASLLKGMKTDKYVQLVKWQIDRARDWCAPLPCRLCRAACACCGYFFGLVNG